jgi:hypothetical protein
MVIWPVDGPLVAEPITAIFVAAETGSSLTV